MAKDQVLARFESLYPEKNGVFQMTSHAGTFAESYLSIRRRESRLLNDEQILNLPEVAPDPAQAKEWQIRLRSASLLRDHLRDHRKKTVLELGCGNGWLTHYLSRTVEDVIGVDINQYELEMAARLFKGPVFVNGDIESKGLILPVSPDAIVIASAIQYFKNPDRLIKKLLTFLAPGGMIHILDSPIYQDEEAACRAHERSKHYFASLGVELPTYYHHHCWNDLGGIPYNVLYHPKAMVSRFTRWLGKEIRPFPWLMIKRTV